MTPPSSASRNAPGTEGRPVCWHFDGEELRAVEGQTVAAALLAAGRRTWRTTGRRGEPRGLFCGMGVCFDCLVRIDGRPNCRACQTPVANGMRVETQHGSGSGEGPA
ncbi:MAG TPA: (2Fe-2S)-binding protein [Gemmataceae bacterium]|nr:(2Fe-2S)-binding protein [Gemmataceae bacterium]